MGAWELTPWMFTGPMTVVQAGAGTLYQAGQLFHNWGGLAGAK